MRSEVPREAVRPRSRERGHPEPGGMPMTPLRLLFAEDNEDIREIVKLFLQTILPADSYTLTLVEDGGAALTHLRAHSTDVAFLDLSMPVLDGWTLAATIKADPA